MLRTFRDRAIVLRSYKLGEADRIVILFGENTGQFRAVAKGVRRTTSKFGARLESFNVVDVQCYRGKGDLDTLIQADTISAYSASLADKFAAFTNAKLTVEAAQKMTAGQELPSPEQFALLHGALHALASESKPPSLVASSYLLRMAAVEGWQPTLTACAVCGGSERLDHFSPASGGAVCTDCTPFEAMVVEPEVLALMDALITPDWQRALRFPQRVWGDSVDIAGSWVQWQLEQRLRALPFATGSQT